MDWEASRAFHRRFPLLGTLRVADFDSDHFPDVAVVGSNRAAIYSGDGSGTFTLLDSFRAGSDCTDFEVADLDHDGLLDLITADRSSASGLIVHRGSRLGGFVHAREYETAGSPVDLVVADVNGDQTLDIVAAEAGEKCTILPGIGNGEFGTEFSLPAGKYSTTVVVDDLTGDGLLDIVSGNGDPNQLGVANLGVGHGRYASSHVDCGLPVSAAASGDMDNDGVADGQRHTVTSCNDAIGDEDREEACELLIQGTSRR